MLDAVIAIWPATHHQNPTWTTQALLAGNDDCDGLVAAPVTAVASEPRGRQFGLVVLLRGSAHRCLPERISATSMLAL
jgi:hypothetical protein